MRGQGRVYRPKVRGRETGRWWLDYSVNGKRHREPAHTSKTEALRLLRQRIDAREAGKVVGRPDKVTFGQLRELAERQYQLDGRRSLDRLQGALAHLERFFGREARAPEITAVRCDEYAEQRLAAGVSRATANYELAALRRAFRLGIEKGLLATMPVIKLPRVRNARSGFFEDGDFAALLLELPADVAALVKFLRLTGWRRGEALGLTWDAVDWNDQAPDGADVPEPGPAASIRLAQSDTKGGKARVFPFGLAPELRESLLAQWAARDGLFVFHRDGQRIGIGALRGAWKRACQRAGVGGRLVHDLRRGSARDLIRAGVPQHVVMKLCGWETDAMFRRYAIVDERDLRDAVAKRFGNGKQAAKHSPCRAVE